MIHCLIGENIFKRREELARIVGEREYRQYDGSEMTVSELPTALGGQSLFGGDEIVVMVDASPNKNLWTALEPWIEKFDADTTLVLLETKLDKRTKTYKLLQKYAKIVVCDNWSSRQAGQAESWLGEFAKSLGISLDPAARRDMVQRAIRPSSIDDKPIIDQQLLATAMKQLALSEGTITPELIETVLPPSLHENVFVLLERAIQGDVATVQRMVSHLASAQQDGHQTFGLLASQASNLAALVLSDESPAQVADDIGAHPYALAQLAPLARGCSRQRMSFIVHSLAHADEQLKSSRGEAWELIEKSLVEIALKK